MKPALLSILIVAALASGQQKPSEGSRQKFTVTGVITDSMCAAADHSHMKMGPTDAACTIACVEAHGALYVLYDGKDVYGLSDQRTPENFAGKKVTVTGTLDAKIKAFQQVDSIVAAK